ncbi:AAA family ATPase [Deferribacteraceae bacterium V6Fe1]|nr:AAA family ATPase [Deferribacteraceae bacterium V6Fe1]
MFEKFFNLKDDPFRITPDPQYFYASDSHEDAINLLKFGIEQKKGFISLIGEVGTGKTTICRVLLNTVVNCESSLILNPLMSPEEILLQIVEDFEIPYEKGENSGKLYNRLAEFLVSNYNKGKNAIIIVDEAQNLSFEAFEMIRQISNIEKEDAKLVQIILVGQNELEERLSENKLRQLNQRIAIRISLSSLTLEETEFYIEHRLSKASIFRKHIFAKSAIKEIYNITRGNPREINQICENCLVIAASLGKKQIDKAIVREAASIYRGSNKKAQFNYKKILALVMLIAVIFTGFVLSDAKKLIQNFVATKKLQQNVSTLSQTNQENEIVKNVDNMTEETLAGETIKKECVFTKVSVNLRAEPLLIDNVIKRLPEGLKCDILKQNDGWVNVDCGLNVGWVVKSDKYIDVVDCE